MTLREGDVVAGWTVEGRVGEGGTSTVWRVRKDGAVAVLKTLRPELRDEPDWHARLLREAEALRAASHPSAVALLDAGTTDENLPFVIMPEIEGESLRALIAREGPLAPARAWSLLRPVALALAAAHDAGIVHRDVKPENVLLPERGPTLVDFGIARAHGEGASMPKVTATGAPVGTPAYMAPEQWWNQGVGPAADQYALGVTLFEAMTGQLPFRDGSFAELVQAHVSKKPATLAERGVSASGSIEWFVARLLEKEPRARFADVREAIVAGDAAFGAREARRGARALLMPLFFLAYGLAQLALFGYPRASSLAEWLRGAGGGVWVTITVYLAAGALLLARRAGYGWALAGAALGTFTTWTGFGAVFHTLARRGPEEAFELFHEGAWEASANRYVGLALASALCFAIVAKSRDQAGPPDGRHRAISFFALALATGCVTLGAPSAAIPFAALAFAPALGAGVPAAFGVLFAAASAVTRAQALCDAVWSLEPTRAARAAALAMAVHERSQALAAAAVAGVAAVALASPSLRALRPRLRSRSGRLALALLGAWLVADLGVVAFAQRQKDALYTQLGPQFALFSRLDPPTASGATTPPPLRPTLKVARDRVALDRDPIGLRSVLETEEGLTVLRGDLSHRVATEEPAAEGEVELLLMADASLPPALVTSALRAAYEVGVRRVGVLLLRGPALRGAPALPEEASYALPRDFEMVRVRLAPDGPRLEGASFGAAASRLATDQTVGVTP